MPRPLTGSLLLFLAFASGTAMPADARRPGRSGELLARALGGELRNAGAIVFAARNVGTDPHWYANFGYWSEDASKMLYGPPGGRLCKLDLRTLRVTPLIDDPAGSIRDPVIHYDGNKILFSYRKGGSTHFNLYEINADGGGLRQLTDGPWDDIEPAYLPNGDIVFCSSRAKRWVSCWFTHVATLHRCDKDGGNIRAISGNIEQDNTPWVMPDGRLLYTRWEYVDRSQVDFHHLWTANSDGTGVQTWFGNMHPGTVMIDARPVPGSNKVAAIFSAGHGRTEHVGDLRLVSPDAGPDERGSARPVSGCPPGVRDPHPISASLFLVARKNEILLVDAGVGRWQSLYEDRQELHEPSVLRSRPRERVIPDRADLTKATGRMVLADVHLGRNMAGVRPGEIKKLLVLETLPKPVNFSGGPGPLTWLGTFNLERVLGTVPVEPDGSAQFELPANRSFLFVALDENDLSVKRMQSFVSVMPGETVSCSGCHEQRTDAPPFRGELAALRRPPSKIEPFAGQPDVVDFPRDVQPILDRHCVRCHSYDRPDGGIVLSGDHGPEFSHSYWMLIASNQVADGRNALGNNPPRTIGSSASALMKKIDGTHHDVKLGPGEWRTMWLWIESGATYCGTYAALGSGGVGVGFRSPELTRVFARRCGACHAAPAAGEEPRGKVVLPAIPERFQRPGRAPHERILLDHDPIVHRSAHALFNLTRSEQSILLLAPLAKDAGGWNTCKAIGPDGAFGARVATFKDRRDPDYLALLGEIRRCADRLNEIKRFDMPGFVPNEHYVREMKRFGILAPSFDPLKQPIDTYAIDEAYWKSLWWQPRGAAR